MGRKGQIHSCCEIRKDWKIAVTVTKTYLIKIIKRSKCANLTVFEGKLTKNITMIKVLILLDPPYNAYVRSVTATVVYLCNHPDPSLDKCCSYLQLEGLLCKTSCCVHGYRVSMWPMSNQRNRAHTRETITNTSHLRRQVNTEWALISCIYTYSWGLVINL